MPRRAIWIRWLNHQYLRLLAPIPDPPALSCDKQSWPNADRACLLWTMPREAVKAEASDAQNRPVTPLAALTQSSHLYIVGRCGAGGAAAAGEIANVSHRFQPSGRCSAANPL